MIIQVTHVRLKSMTRRCLTGVAILLLAGVPTVEEALAQPAPSTAAAKKAPATRYRPRTTGAPAVRVTGGSRGSGDALAALEVLAPDEVGLTTREQPSLFWYQSKPTEAKFEWTLLRENQAAPILRLTVDRAAKAGIQRLELSDHGVKLELNVEYQWVVALVTDPENRSSDLVASGAIKRIDPPAELKQKITGAAAASLPSIYAEEGIWYDAMTVLADQIVAHPEDGALRETRNDLLRQVGLKAAIGL